MAYLRAWSTINGEPRKESPRLMGRENVHFKHGGWVWTCVDSSITDKILVVIKLTDRTVQEFIDAKLLVPVM